jgi:hypothetical protein
MLIHGHWGGGMFSRGPVQWWLWGCLLASLWTLRLPGLWCHYAPAFSGCNVPMTLGCHASSADTLMRRPARCSLPYNNSYLYLFDSPAFLTACVGTWMVEKRHVLEWINVSAWLESFVTDWPLLMSWEKAPEGWCVSVCVWCWFISPVFYHSPHIKENGTLPRCLWGSHVCFIGFIFLSLSNIWQGALHLLNLQHRAHAINMTWHCQWPSYSGFH